MINNIWSLSEISYLINDMDFATYAKYMDDYSEIIFRMF
jgi:hypothetical protein